MTTIVRSIEDALHYEISQVQVEEYWNLGDTPELKIHSIHAYPAKFPAFIASKAIQLAYKSGIEVNTVSDIFCGCGTVAIEAKLNGVNFWGCDINPIATLITKAKIGNYSISKLEELYNFIQDSYSNNRTVYNYEESNERIRYWFKQEQFYDLSKLKEAIMSIPKGKYRTCFECLFSSILKPTSKWLTKSIKPQIDPNKNIADVWKTFERQFRKFTKCVSDMPQTQSNIEIVTCSILTKKSLPKVDLIITSPPYVTSYEYADLHQLSSLWLDFTDDYTLLRKGTMGSAYNSETFNYDILELNETAREIILELKSNKKISKAKIKSIARYYIDMQKATEQCYKMLNPHGMALFVIGDTEYKGTQIHNSRQLVESLIKSGFREVTVSKRKIRNKILTPYRDENGKFTSNKDDREIYHEEFVITGRK
ncbi:MAG: DNA adenine methylase [Clostridia bacterium]|nr:DNA adenine methylase [Clostridia bacterium]MBR0188981.1 DNA adenine methylase [Clostridia bacterium]